MMVRLLDHLRDFRRNLRAREVVAYTTFCENCGQVCTMACRQDAHFARQELFRLHAGIVRR